MAENTLSRYQSQTGSTKRGPRMSRQRRKLVITAYLFVLPAMLFFYGVRMIPMGFALYLSFTDWDILTPVSTIVGIDNYVNALTNKLFLTSLRNTTYYTAIIVLAGIPLALLLAMLVANLTRPVSVGVRFAFFIPLVTSTVAVTVIWAWIYQPVYGLFNSYLQMLGLPAQGWLLDPGQVIPSIALMSIWKGIGYNIIIFFAGLNAIDQTYYEAAAIDGANRWHLFRRITLPLLKPTTLLVFVTTIIGSFQVFVQVYIMTKGGPGHASRVVGLHIYEQAFMNLKMGSASAMAMILFAIILALTLFQLRVGRSNVEY